MATIIVSYDGTDSDRDALSLGQLLAGAADPDPDDLSVFGIKLVGPGIRCRGHAGVQQSLEQTGNQRSACHTQVCCALIDRRVQPRPGLSVETDVGPVRGERRDPIPPLAQPGEIERSSGQRSSAARAAARQLGFVIRETMRDFEMQTAVRLHEVEHGRPGSHKRLDQRRVHRAE